MKFTSMNIGRIASIANISIVKILKNCQSIDKSCIVKLSKNQKYRNKGYRKKIPKHSSIIKKLRSKYRKKKKTNGLEVRTTVQGGI